MEKKDYVESYLRSGGLNPEVAERMWEKGQLEKQAPALAAENAALRAELAQVQAERDELKQRLDRTTHNLNATLAMCDVWEHLARGAEKRADTYRARARVLRRRSWRFRARWRMAEMEVRDCIRMIEARTNRGDKLAVALAAAEAERDSARAQLAALAAAALGAPGGDGE